MKKAIIFSCVGLLLCACTPKYHYVGKNLEKEDVAKIKVGQHSKHDVAQILGSPSIYSMFQEDRWYYTSKITEAKAFLKPVTSEQDTYAISFDEKGVVKEVRHIGLGDTKKIGYVERETPTTGTDTSMLQQLFGNFGRITRGDKLQKG